MNIAVIFAGGMGKRMKTDGIPKQFLEVNGRPILAHTLSVFQRHPEIDAIVLVMIADWIQEAASLVAKYDMDKVRAIVPGGDTGQESIHNGLIAAKGLVEQLGQTTSETIVLIHDGVRPVIDEELLTRNIEGVKAFGSAITCVPCNETVVMVDEAGDRVTRTVERKDTRIAKAPQSFYLPDILSAHERALMHGVNDVVDSCTLMQIYGSVVPAVVEGSFDNIKVTTPEDYYTLKALLDLKSGKLAAI